MISTFQSTLPVGGATKYVGGELLYASISIHAPRGGSDNIPPAARPPGLDFNPRSPWGERPKSSARSGSERIFQSTLPVGGATEHLNICRATWAISIHAPRGGSDIARLECGQSDMGFQSTLPVGGERPAPPSRRASASADFNPRSPWGERRARLFPDACTRYISTHAPRGGATILDMS